MSAHPRPLLGQTPSQTVGPYFAYGLTPEQYGYAMTAIASPDLADEATPGQRIRIEGRVLDGAGEPITDAMIEIWQADAEGRYGQADGSNTSFSGFGRCGTGTDPDARFAFSTIKPGVASSDDFAAPHIDVTVMMRGLLTHAFTRIYFEDETAANESDELLASVPRERKHTLLAKAVRPGFYQFDIRMQGDDETVFFDL